MFLRWSMVVWSTCVLCLSMTCGLCSPSPFYCIYFQVEQPQLPNNDIKSAGMAAQGERMLTRVITETTCRGSNSFQVSRWCSPCADSNLVTSFKGCFPVVVPWRSIHACMVRGLLLFGHFLFSSYFENLFNPHCKSIFSIKTLRTLLFQAVLPQISGVGVT